VAWNADTYTVDEGSKSVITATHFVRNDRGSWVCRFSTLDHGSGAIGSWDTGITTMCDGEGDYDGLSAFLVIDGVDPVLSLEGLIFSGDAPPPAPPAAG